MKAKNIFLSLGILIIFLFARLMHLDADLPSFKLMSYAAMDEFYYSICPFNLVQHMSFINSEIPGADIDASPFNILLNLFTYLTLQIFGNNYFGLRFASGLCSLVLVFFVISSLRKTSVFWNSSIDNKNKIHLIYFEVLVFLFFAIDFSFLMASRVSEPGIGRALMLVVLIWYVASNDKMILSRPYIFSFIFGFLALFSISFGYMYNFFYAGAAGLTLFLITLKNRDSYKSVFFSVCFFALGAIMCCFIYEFFIQIFFKKSLFDFLGTVTFVSDARVVERKGGLISYIIQIKNLFLVDFGTNMFSLNLSFLLLTLLALPIYFYRTVKLKKNVDIFISCLVVFWFAQSFFENSYPIKRHTIMFPVFVFILIYSFEEVYHFFESIKRSLIRKIIYSIYLLTSGYIVFFVAGSFIKKFKGDSSGLMAFEVINVMCCMVVLIILSIMFLSKKVNMKFMTFSLFFLVVPSGYLFVNNILINSTYNYKLAMIDMNHYIKNSVTAGGVSYSFRLYNSSKPALNVYMYQYHDKPELKRRLIELFKIADYCIMIPNKKQEKDSANFSGMEVGYLNEISHETNYSFKLVKLYDIGDRHVLLIKKVERPNV